MSEITSFSDSSWQDCPDSGRITIGYKIFIQGGIVEWNTSLPVPIAMSSSEAEYMAACMSMTHRVNQILYNWNETKHQSTKLHTTNLQILHNLLPPPKFPTKSPNPSRSPSSTRIRRIGHIIKCPSHPRFVTIHHLVSFQGAQLSPLLS